jgi:hypothetical protein
MKSSKIVLISLMAVATFGSAHAATFIADPFTAVSIGTGGGGTTNIQPGSLFNQRRLQALGSGSSGPSPDTTVGSGAWTGTLIGSNGVTRAKSILTYSQDNVGSTIDLSEITSMSFDMTVTGAVIGTWYLLDSAGRTFGWYEDFYDARPAGTNMVTLDFSTADFDHGFDLSAVRSMRISAEANSFNPSFSVSNFRYTSSVPEPGMTMMVALGLGTLTMMRRRRKSA